MSILRLSSRCRDEARRWGEEETGNERNVNKDVQYQVWTKVTRGQGRRNKRRKPLCSQRWRSGGTQQSKCRKPSFEVNLHEETVDEDGVDSEGVICYKDEVYAIPCAVANTETHN